MIGTGDIKVLAVLGSVLGPRKILFCIVTAFLLGAVESLFLLFFAVTGGSGSYISFSIFSGHTLNDHFHRIWCRGKDRKIFILQYQF